MTHDEFVTSLETIFSEAVSIARKKNADYSKVSDPFLNFRLSPFVGVSVERGILVRICDKISRVQNLLDQEPQVVEESIEDTLKDIINYSAILLTYIKNK